MTICHNIADEVIIVADYKEMYLQLFRDVTRAIDILQHAQIKVEELFISGGDGEEVPATDDEHDI